MSSVQDSGESRFGFEPGRRTDEAGPVLFPAGSLEREGDTNDLIEQLAEWLADVALNSGEATDER